MSRFLLLVALGLTLAACDSNTIDPPDLNVRTATDIAADPATRDPNTGQVLGSGQFTLFSLRVQDDPTTTVDERIVVNYDAAERADSASTRWDIGFRGTDVILNSGTSGPGAAVGVIVSAAFGVVTNALDPSYVYRRDGESSCPDIQTPVGPQLGPRRVVCGGSGNGWYTYVPFPNTPGGYILPTPGRTLVLRLADNSGYAKLNFLSYYQGNPAPSTITAQSQERFYTFEYVVNDQGASFVEDEEN